MEYFKKVNNDLTITHYVKHEDYLKVVEEKEYKEYLVEQYKKHVNDLNKRIDGLIKRNEEIEKELKEKDEKYLKVVDDNTHLLKTFNGRYEIFKKELKEKDEKIERLREYLKIGKNIAEVVLGYHVLKENLDKTIKYNHEIIENNNELRSCIIETGSQNDILQEELEKAKDINVDLAFENKELKEENKRIKENNEVLTELLKGEEEERLWVLEYIYCDDRGNCKTVALDPQPKEELEEIIGMDSNNWVQYKMKEVE